MSGGLFGILAAFSLTLGVLVIAVWMLRRLQGHGNGRGRGVRLELLQRMSVGPRQGVALPRVGDRVLVVTLAEGGAPLLRELSGPALTEALGAVPSADPHDRERSRRSRFASLLGPFGLAMALLLVPVGPRDQAMAAATGSAAPAGNLVPTVSPPLPPQVDIRLGEGKDAFHLQGTVGLVVFLGLLTLLPAMFLLMTSFTRILIVLHFLRSALGTQTTPPGQLLVAIAVLLTGVVMNPVLQETNRSALQPYFKGQITQPVAYERAIKPFREFMLANTRDQDLTLFAELGRVPPVKSEDELPTLTVISAFVTSELRTAFQMGFVIFLPFVVLDVIVASVLMSLGMFMLPPMMVSLPFKLLLFVLADGWTLVVQNLVASFR